MLVVRTCNNYYGNSKTALVTAASAALKKGLRIHDCIEGNLMYHRLLAKEASSASYIRGRTGSQDRVLRVLLEMRGHDKCYPFSESREAFIEQQLAGVLWQNPQRLAFMQALADEKNPIWDTPIEMFHQF